MIIPRTISFITISKPFNIPKYAGRAAEAKTQDRRLLCKGGAPDAEEGDPHSITLRFRALGILTNQPN